MADLYLTAGSGITIVENTSSSTITVNSTFENRKSAVIPLNTNTPLTGAERNYITIPSSMNGWSLVEVVASSGSSTSGSPAFLVKACPATAISGSQNMLTTNPVIGQSAFYSGAGTGSVSAVVDPSNKTVSTGTKVWVYSASASTCGSAVYYAEVTLTFQKE